MTEQPIEERILSAIEKSGFPSELKALRAFLTAGLDTSPNIYFFDRDEKKGREIDLYAVRLVGHSSLKKTPVVRVIETIYCEVKKSETPWVIFSAGQDSIGTAAMYNLLHTAINVDRNNLPPEVINRHHYVESSPRRGRTGFEPFKKDQNFDSRISEAILKTVKAAIGEQQKTEAEKYSGRSLFEIQFYSPMVVLDGRLFEAYLDDETGKLKIEETEQICLFTRYMSDGYPTDNVYTDYMVDVVTLKGLERLLELKHSWLKGMYRHICKPIEFGPGERLFKKRKKRMLKRRR